jgi:predicted N-formylglutamate amidohydrolase
LILCDHGGKRIPRQLGDLGLPQHEIDRHIGWDLGVLTVSHMSRLLNAPLVHQIYSRLVIDCNRQPGIPSSIPEVSEATTIPGNIGLTQQERDQRRDEIFTPYH